MTSGICVGARESHDRPRASKDCPKPQEPPAALLPLPYLFSSLFPPSLPAPVVLPMLLHNPDMWTSNIHIRLGQYLLPWAKSLIYKPLFIYSGRVIMKTVYLQRANRKGVDKLFKIQRSNYNVSNSSSPGRCFEETLMLISWERFLSKYWSFSRVVSDDCLDFP